MPELDPAWEYATCDPEVYEAVYGRTSRDFDQLPELTARDYGEPTGYRFGRKGQINRMNFRLGREKKSRESRFVYHIRCARCGDSFLPRRDDSRFCSVKCHLASVVRPPPRTAQCKRCGKDFRPQKADQKYCSVGCYGGNTRKLPDFFTCKRCGVPYRPYRWKSVVCGQACVGRQRTLPDVTCPCGKTFRPDHANAKYCSVKCVPHAGAPRVLPDRACTCGVTFRPLYSSHRFCTHACANKGTGPKPPPAETLAAFAALYAAGAKMTDLSAKFNVGVCQLKRWRRQLRLAPRPPGRKPQNAS